MYTEEKFEVLDIARSARVERNVFGADLIHERLRLVHGRQERVDHRDVERSMFVTHIPDGLFSYIKQAINQKFKTSFKVSTIKIEKSYVTSEENTYINVVPLPKQFSHMDGMSYAVLNEVDWLLAEPCTKEEIHAAVVNRYERMRADEVARYMSHG